MVRFLNRWKKPILWVLALCYSALRAPEILTEGGWRTWVFVPVCLFLVWVLVADVREALHGQADLTAEKDQKATDPSG